ncbi:MAG: hypothetical protein M3303_07660 [Gemmatimonadota bacterium]|nr:hypothetical protein [Gemmatimonadota bacterium]
MTGRTLDAVLRRLNDAKEVRDGDRVLELWRDFDSEEVRLRDRVQKRVVAVDEHQLELTIGGLGQPITAAMVSSLLCRICDDPERYFGTRVLPLRSSRAARRRP